MGLAISTSSIALRADKKKEVMSYRAVDVGKLENYANFC